MLDDLTECIETSKKARDALLAGALSVREANAVSAQNHNIISAYALDLRQRIFAAEQRVVNGGHIPHVLSSAPPNTEAA